MPETYSAKQVANRIGTDAKTLRKFLRSSASPYTAVGQGKRYEFPKDELAEMKKLFNAWQTKNRARMTKAETTPKVDPDSARRTREAAFNKAVEEGMELIDELDEGEPTDEELDDIEDEDLEIEDE